MAEIPVLLLKTRTTPDDGYEEYFTTAPATSGPRMRFKPVFVPVLEHTPNIENLEKIERLLRHRELKREYGGMIFTSQRAVEGWRGVVERVENGGESESGMVCSLFVSVFNLFKILFRRSSIVVYLGIQLTVRVQI